MTIVSPSPESLQNAATTLRQGGVIAFATETVYGLGCDIYNEQAIRQVYTLKGRPLNNPMIAHILDVSWASRLTDHWNEKCEKLAGTFWPGGLTLILPRSNSVLASACGGFNTVAMRCPAHPVAIDLLASFGGPVSAPSANKSGHISPTTAKHVEEEFEGAVLVLDGGPCEIGIESTVVSMVDEPTVLRLGSVSTEAMRKVIGDVQIAQTNHQSESPGTSARHYAPISNVTLLTSKEIQEIEDDACVAIIIGAPPKTSSCNYEMPTNPREYGNRLYAMLREADAKSPTKIVIELPPTTKGWEAIHDRLIRCAASH